MDSSFKDDASVLLARMTLLVLDKGFQLCFTFVGLMSPGGEAARRLSTLQTLIAVMPFSVGTCLRLGSLRLP